MEIIIKKAKTEQDTQTANNLLTKLINYESKFNKNIKEDFIIKDFYEKRLDDNNCIAIAYNEKNEVLGYLYGYFQKYNTNFNGIGFIDAIYIEEKYRKNHVVTKLVEYFKKWTASKDGNEIELNVLKDNEIAFETYKHLGFKITKYTMSQKI